MRGAQHHPARRLWDALDHDQRTAWRRDIVANLPATLIDRVHLPTDPDDDRPPVWPDWAETLAVQAAYTGDARGTTGGPIGREHEEPAA